MQVPWEPRTTTPKVGWLDAWFLGLFDRFARAALVQGQLRLILPNGEERCYGAASACSGGLTQRSWTHAAVHVRLQKTQRSKPAEA